MEIEHKFLVKGDYKSQACECHHIVQGYLSDDPCRTVRVRTWDEKGFLTIKGKSSASGLSRYEWEKEIPVAEAEDLLKLCLPGVIDKHRHIVNWHGAKWEVDEFHGFLAGLTLAEIEVESEDCTFDIPPFIGKEVTGDKSYYNSQLRKRDKQATYEQ